MWFSSKTPRPPKPPKPQVFYQVKIWIGDHVESFTYSFDAQWTDNLGKAIYGLMTRAGLAPTYSDSYDRRRLSSLLRLADRVEFSNVVNPHA